MTTATAPKTLADRLEEKRADQARELARFTEEETLREELGKALDLSPDRAFIHCRELYGVTASVHLRDKMSFAEAIDLIEKLEAVLSPVEMVRASGSFLSHFTADYWEKMPDEKAMSYKQHTRLLPLKIELSRFGNSLHYFGRLADGRTIDIKCEVHTFNPFLYVDCTYTKRTLTQTRLGGACGVAHCIHDEEGQTLGHLTYNKMFDGERGRPSQNFYVQWENINESEDISRFKIGQLRGWMKN